MSNRVRASSRDEADFEMGPVTANCWATCWRTSIFNALRAGQFETREERVELTKPTIQNVQSRLNEIKEHPIKSRTFLLIRYSIMRLCT